MQRWIPRFWRWPPMTAPASRACPKAQATARIAELETFAKQYLAENYTPQFGDDTEMDVDIDITGQSIDLTASHDFPTTIMRLTGIDEVNLTSHAQVMKAMRPIEIALVMDTTGSMATDNKIQGAKDRRQRAFGMVYGGTAATVPESEYIACGAGALRRCRSAQPKCQ